MKLLYIFMVASVLTGIETSAQVSINTDGTPPNNSAMLDVKSSTRGLLPPRMTHAEINAIASPANGLIVYCTDCGTNGQGAFFGCIYGTWQMILTCIPAASPPPGIQTAADNQIIWNWNAVPGATGYRWSDTINYASAADMGTETTKTETGLNCNTQYARYVWASNSCGISAPATLVQTTTFTPPAAPLPGNNVPALTQVTWNWSTVNGASGYKWNITNNYATATDMGTSTTKIETGLFCNTAYTRFVWAYTSCGNSGPTPLNQSTLQNPTVGVTVTASANPSCSGASVTLTATPLNGGAAPGFQWKKNGTIVQGATNATYTCIPANGDAFSCQLTSEIPCSVNNPATSNTVTMSVLPLLLAGSISSNQWVCYNSSPACLQGVVPANGTSPVYQWQQSSDNISFANINGATGLLFCPPGLTATTYYRLRQDASGTCGGPLYTNTVTITVTPLSPVSVTIAASANPVCSGTSVIFTATPVNGGTSPAYQWKVNGSNVTGATNSTYTSSPVNGSTVNCVLTSNVNCVSGNPATSNTVTMVVNAPPVTPATGTHVPAQTQIVWNWNAVTGATGYKWNTTNNYTTATDMGTATSKTEAGLICGTSYTRYAWAYNACGNSSPVSLSTTTSACNTYVCGQPVTDIRDGKTYTTVLIGTQCWLKENLNIGTMIGSGTSQSNNSILEKYCYNNVSTNCNNYGGLYQWNEMMQYSTTPGIQGICPAEWHLPADVEWTTLSTFLGGLTLAGGPMKETGTSHWASPNTGATNASGFTGLPGGYWSWTSVAYANMTFWGFFWTSSQYNSSNGIYRALEHQSTQMYVNNYGKADAYSVRCIKDCPAPTGVNAGPDQLNVPGTSTTLAAITPGASETGTWSIFSGSGGNIASLNNPASTFTGIQGTTYVLRWMVTKTCGSPAIYDDVTISFSCTAPATPAAGIQTPSISSVVWNWSTASGATGYKWNTTNNYATATDMGTATTKTETGLTCNTAYTRYVWAYNACGNSAATTLTQTTSQSPATGVNIAASANPVCTGTTVTFTATPVNGGTSPAYQWKKGGSIVTGATNSTFSYPPANNDILTCEMTSGNPCTPNNPAISNSITMTVNPMLPVSVTIAASANPVCTGSSVTFTATPVNGGSSPAYQWKVNGAIVSGATGTTYAYAPANNDAITGILTSNTECTSGNPATSNTVTMTVNPVAAAPTAGTHVPATTQIIWNWNPVTSATGYKWNTTNNYATATDMGTATTKTETGLTCNTAYTRYVWAYNTCGNSAVTVLTQSSSQSPAASVTIAASSNPVCTGITVTFTATPENGGTSPAYQWKKGGSIVPGATNSTYEYTPANSDVLTCEMTSGNPCTPNNPAVSNSITMTVSTQPLVPTAGTHVPSATQIIWNWNPVPGVTGYKWNTVNDINTAIDLGDTTAQTDTGLLCNTSYTRYLWAYNVCASSMTTLTQTTSACGTPCPGVPTVTYEGKTYNTVLIGTQCWLKENLNVGTMVSSYGNQSDNGIIEKYCFMNVEAYCDTYGGLYQWAEFMNYMPTSSANPSRVQGICPPGWHVPSVAEWSQLTDTLGGEAVAGGKLKESGLAHWSTPNTGATNATGFTALPAGPDVGITGIFWSSTNISGQWSWSKSMLYNTTSVTSATSPILLGLSGRCVKDTCTTYSMVNNSVSASANPFCTANQVTFTATPVNAGTSPFYQWKVNGVNVGSGSASYSYSPTNNDVVTCRLSSDLPCASGNPAMSNAITLISEDPPAAPAAGTHVPSPTQVTWNWNPVTGATGYKWNTTNSYATATDMGTATAKTETGLTCGTPYTRFVWAYTACSSVATTLTQSTIACGTSCPVASLTINHLVSGGVAPVNKTTTYGTVTGIPGETTKCWITSNLGSDHQATSVDDATEASAGWYWQFNRKQGYKHDGSVVTPAWTITAISETSDWTTANDPCNIELGTNWRIPTYTEWNNVKTAGGWTNWYEPWSSGLKLHAAGQIRDGNLYNRGLYGYSWSSTQSGSTMAWYLIHYRWDNNVYNEEKAKGSTVRCLTCNVPATPSPGSHIPSLYQIIWNWTPVTGATGYKWNTTNDYATATDMGNVTSKTETGLTCFTTYTRYVWAYNDCGTAASVALTQATTGNLPATPAEATHVPSSTQITWNWSAAADATGYKWNTTNDYATATDMGTATTKTDTGLICTTAYTRYLWAYNNCGHTPVLTISSGTLSCGAIACGTDSLTISHLVSNGVAPVNKNTKYGTVTNIPGEPTKCWITSNLGSDHQATAVTDATEASAGWYWQFNRKQGYKHDGTNRIPNTSWITSINENSDWQTANDPCNIELGTAWRLPTYAEWNNVDNTGGWTNWNGPWNSGIKLHAAGFLNSGTGFPESRGSAGFYWSGSQKNTSNGWNPSFDNNNCNMGDGTDKARGLTIRCLRENCGTTISSPVEGSHVPGSNQIIWNWNAVPGASGYKWSTTNDYYTATVMGTSTTKTETGITCGTAYTRYVWAYNNCGNSVATSLVQSTSVCSVPAITTTTITAITQTTATGGGNVTLDGGTPVTVRGVCWSTVTNPSIADSKTIDGTGTGSYTSSITGLLANTTYFVRAYATNSTGTAYGEQASFTTPPFSIGLSYGGGIIFYIDGTGQHGMIAAISDQSNSANWGCPGTLVGTAPGIGSGQANSAAIIGICTDAGIAARICIDLVLNGYDDWFLPSKEELNLMYGQKTVIGGFSDTWYLSSFEYGAWSVWGQNFSDGSQQYGLGKTQPWLRVRAVRSF